MSFPLKGDSLSQNNPQTHPDGDTVMSDGEFVSLFEELGQPSAPAQAPAPAPAPAQDSTMASAVPDDGEFGGPESAGNFTPACSQESAPRPAANSESPLQPRLSQGSNAARSREHSSTEIPAVGRRVADLLHPLTNAVLFVLFLRRFWHTQNLLVILSDFFWSCVSDSKCFSAIAPPQVSEHRGITWSFVFGSGTSIPKEAQEVINFFEKIKGLAQVIPWDNYVVPTCNLRENLVPKKTPGSKHISGVMKKTFVDVDESNIFRSSEGGVDYSKVLSAGDGMMTGDVFTPMDLFTIHVGFTGALFTKLEKASVPSRESTQESAAPSMSSEAPRDSFAEIGKDSQIFCIVTVTCLPNVDVMGFITNRLINPQYDIDKTSERQRGLREQFHRILIHQSSGMMGDKSGEMPSSYYSNPTGRLGIDRTCSPNLEPCKALYYLMQKYTHIREVKIIGYYDIDYQADPRTNAHLQKYLEYSTAYIGQVKAARDKLNEALLDFNKPRNTESKKKRARGGPEEVERDDIGPIKEYEIPPIPGWPVSRNAELYTEFRVSLCPIFMKYRPLNEIDVNMSFQIWSVNLGGVPPVVESALLGFVLYDLEKDEVTDLRSVILKDVEVRSSLERTLSTYYVRNANSLHGIATPGCLLLRYNDINRHVKKEIENGNMTTEEADRMNQSIIAYGMSTFDGMVNSGQFSSKRISQLAEIKERVKKMQMKREIDVYTSMNEYASVLMEESPLNSCNAYEVVQRLIFLCLEDINRFEHLNSINLYNKYQLLVSMTMYMMGLNSNTIIPFGRLIMIAPCAGTLREPLQKDSVRKVNNQNGAGKDITHTKVSENQQSMCQKIGILVSLQGCHLGSRATPVSLENASSIQIDHKGNVVGLPDEFSSWLYYIYPECRNDDVWKMIIEKIAPRGKFVQEYSQTTVEGPNKTRVTVIKIVCYPIGVLQVCTNQPIPNQDRNEQVTTIAAVTHLTEAGSTPITEESENGEINDIHRNEFECRASEFEGNTERYAHIFLALTHTMCIYQTCLPSWTGVFTPEINPATIALLDHMSFFTRHLNSMFHISCQTNSGTRLRQVYESRASAETAWMKSIQYFMECPEIEDAMKKARISFQYDAVSIFQVPRIQYELIRRCMNWGPVIYACCYIKEVNMPIVPTAILVELLNMDNPPPEDERSERRRQYDAISTWLFECVHNQRFCPANHLTETSEYTEYISSSGTEFGTKEGQGGFRSDQTQNGWKDSIEKMTAESQLAEELYQICGEELMKACTVSKESIIYIIRDAFKFSLGLQKFLGFSYEPDKQFRFFGIRDQYRFKFNVYKGTPPFLCKAAWIRANESVSVGVGFHWLQLLLIGSLIGPFSKLKIHSKCVNDLSRSLVRQLLINSPASAVTSETIGMPCFNCFNGRQESIVMGEYEKMEHFLRSGKDVGFAWTGNVPECRGFQEFFPEDILHMGSNCEFARRVGCKLVDVPPTTVLSYAIRRDKYYCVYNKAEDLLGYLTFGGAEISVLASSSRDADPEREMQGFSLSAKAWNSELGERGYIMLPMVWRSGACVLIPPKAGDQASREMIGCIVPPPGVDSEGAQLHSDGNYCYSIQSYFAGVRVGEIIQVHVLDVMKHLLPIGKKLFLKCESQSAAPLIRRLKAPLSAESRSTHAIRVFLTGPSVKTPIPGKVYVAYAVGTSQGDEANQNNSGEIACVDPWELLASAGPRTIFESISP